jgi:hypothetical protein
MVEQSPQRKRKRRRPVETPVPNEKLQNWGLGLIAVGLIGLLLPSFGLQLRRLQALGEAQWIVLAVAVVVGSGAVLWANRSRPAFGGSVAGGAFVAMLLFAYVSFWRHAGGAAPADQVAGGDAAAGGGGAVTPSGGVPKLTVQFEGEIPASDFPLLVEFMKDCVPAATSVHHGHGTQPTGPGGVMMVTRPRFGIGPVPDIEELMGRVTFGTASMVDGNTLRVQVKVPLPPRAESIRRRLAFALDGIRSNDARRQLNGMLLLESLEPVDRRDEVATELVEILLRPNPPVSTANALKKWGTRAQAADLLRHLKEEGANQGELLDVLISISPDDAIRGAIELLPNDPGMAEGVLTRIGAPAEPTVIALLAHAENQVRLMACRLLLQIGSEASLAPLEPLQTDPDLQVADYARRAVEVIRERLKR